MELIIRKPISNYLIFVNLKKTKDLTILTKSIIGNKFLINNSLPKFCNDENRKFFPTFNINLESQFNIQEEKEKFNK